VEDRAKIAEFYMDNLILTNMNFWDPNSRMGDVQLIALAYWLTHEEARVEKEKRVISKETNEPLWVRAELRTPHLVISNHRFIFEDPKLVPLYIEKQEQVIRHFEDIFILLGDRGLVGLSKELALITT